MATRKILQFDKSGAPVGMVEFDDSGRLSDLRIVPELLPIIQGYKNQDMVAPVLFKEAPQTTKESGKFPSFGSDAWFLQDASRALRAETQKVEFPNSEVAFSLVENALGFMIDNRELEEFALGREALMTIRTQMINKLLDLKEEWDAASQATLTSNYDAAVSGAAYDWAGAGKPVDHISAQQEVLRQQVGAYADTIIFSPGAWNLFRLNSNVKSYLYAAPTKGQGVLVSEEIAAAILQVKTVRVGKMVKKNAAGTVANVWDANQTDNVILAYTGSGMGEPTYGMKFSKKGYPKVESYYWNPNKSEVFDVQRLYQYKITLASAGQLIYSID